MNPRRPLRPCGRPGCPKLTRDRLCPACAAEERRRYDHQRGTAAARGYGARWQRESAEFLQQHPWCIDCGAPSAEVDHEVPHRGDMVLFWDKSNWRPRCKTCHSRKTATRDSGFARRG